MLDTLVLKVTYFEQMQRHWWQSVSNVDEIAFQHRTYCTAKTKGIVHTFWDFGVSNIDTHQD